MNDNEILKALKCCGETPKCRECPYSQKCKYLPKDTIDLINRQKAEIEKNQAAYELCKQEYDSMFNANKNLLAEIERLNIRNKALMAITKNYNWKFAKAKSEAIKEFAERLKELSYLPNLSLTNIEVVDIREIDNLVKEMTEGL